MNEEEIKTNAADGQSALTAFVLRKVHAEIEYVKESGDKIHSDICPGGCNSNGLNDSEYREFLHKCLDEWLDNSRGTGGFYIKDAEYDFDA